MRVAQKENHSVYSESSEHLEHEEQNGGHPGTTTSGASIGYAEEYREHERRWVAAKVKETGNARQLWQWKDKVREEIQKMLLRTIDPALEELCSLFSDKWVPEIRKGLLADAPDRILFLNGEHSLITFEIRMTGREHMLIAGISEQMSKISMPLGGFDSYRFKKTIVEIYIQLRPIVQWPRLQRRDRLAT